MALFGLTTNYKFKLIDFNTATWHNDEYDNWREIDALLFNFIQLSGVIGVWTNSIAYVVGNRLIDGDGSTIWEVQVAHTSAAAGTFSADRITNPTYWTEIGASALNEQSRRFAAQARTAAGNAQAALSQANNDVALTATSLTAAQTVLVQVRSMFRSIGAYLAQTVGWAYAAETSKTAAAASASAASTSETNAGTSETNAGTSETNAQTAETNAETAETGALAAQTAAELAETNAETAETGATASEAAALQSEQQAQHYAERGVGLGWGFERRAKASALAAAASAASSNQGNDILQAQVYS